MNRLQFAEQRAMRKAFAIPATAIFLILAPGIVAGYVPWLMTHWRFESSSWEPDWLRWFGAVLIAVGVIALIECFARFALRGRGTPAPVMPTEILVTSGLYRYVRNPMSVAVFVLVFGQAMLFAKKHTMVYAICVWLAFAVFVLLYEEPTLRRRYGEEYRKYCHNVPRWVPRLTPWQGA